MVVEIGNKVATQVEHWSGKIPGYAYHLQSWGEAGTVKIKTKMHGKVANRGESCMFVGYALGHSPDTYRMWRERTNSILVTRDVIWLRRMYFQKAKSEAQEVNPQNADEAESSDEEVEILEENQTGVAAGEEENNESDVDDDADDDNAGMQTKEVQDLMAESATHGAPQVYAGRTQAEAHRLAGEQAMISLTEAEKHYYSEVGHLEMEFACVGAGIGGGFTNTAELHVMTYDEALATPDREKWKVAIQEEYERMKDHDVFKAVPMNQVPDGTKVITATWAMKKKASGKYRARMAARGFQQVDGESYDEHTKASPVVSPMTIMIVFVLMAMASWYGHLLDVNGAFLLGNFERGKKIYMHVPQGFEPYYGKNVVLLLLHTLYGTKQAAIMFW